MSKKHKKILVTDDLFIFAEHEKQFADAGFDVDRLQGNYSESDLRSRLADKTGYIIGGIEKVTEAVLDSAAKLEAIAFTGAGYKEFIVAHEEARRRGIKISNAPGANSSAVARFTISQILSATRRWPELFGAIMFSPEADDPSLKTYLKNGTVFDAENLTVAVIGFGAIGRKVANYLKFLGFNILVASDVAASPGEFETAPIADAIKRANIVTLHVSKGRGDNVLDANLIAHLGRRSIVVNSAFPEAVDQAALAQRLRNGDIFAAFDKPIKDIDVADIVAKGFLVQSKFQMAYNTVQANKITSDIATSSMINMLTKGHDQHQVA